MKIISVSVPRPIDQIFFYKVTQEQAEKIQRGSFVKVSFGRGKTHAFVVDEPRGLEHLPDSISIEKIKEIIEVGSVEYQIPKEIFQLAEWVSQYYQVALGEVLSQAFPSVLTSDIKKKKQEEPVLFHKNSTVKELTSEQENAVKAIESASDDRPWLLHGVTGSGKTEVYAEVAKKILKEGKSVLFLVPEIALTQQLQNRLQEALQEKVGFWHSAMPDGSRRKEWLDAKEGRIRVVVGARSAIFSPLKNLGLIVVDEEHDVTYKQEDRVRYHARDVAVVRAKMAKAKIILGSATPSFESLQRVQEGKYNKILLEQRFSKSGLPNIQLIDLATEPLVEGIQATIALKTLNRLQETIDRNEQAMIFLNRKGFASFLICEDCREVPQCKNCSISLTVHKKAKALKCHVCGYFEESPDTCPSCKGNRWLAVGAGTESIELELPTLLQKAKILRLDRDLMTSQFRVEKALSAFRNREFNILLGTQMLTKGHDFPGVTLVIVLFADAFFRYPDFRSNERAHQVLTQVSGRAGRADLPGEVFIQTYSPDHPVLKVLMGEKSTEEFIQEEMQLRSLLHYSPFGRGVRLRIEDTVSAQARLGADRIRSRLEAVKLDQFEILGPSEAFLEKAKGIYRYDILLKSVEIQTLLKAVYIAKVFSKENEIDLLVDIDPYSVS